MVKLENFPYIMTKGLLPYIILAAIKTQKEATAYAVIKRIHDELDVVMSVATVYTAIYSLEREGYVKRTETDRAAKYRITSKGLILLQNAIVNLKELTPKIQLFLEKP
jgi:DNA-binding PadR family transcriptional regulator